MSFPMPNNSVKALERHVYHLTLPYPRGGCQGTPALRPQFGPNAQNMYITIKSNSSAKIIPVMCEIFAKRE